MDIAPTVGPESDVLPSPRPRRRRLSVAILLVVALVGVPSGVVLFKILRSARLISNESQAIATLKNLSSAQSQLQASGLKDHNGNGAGEYGYFAELAGAVPVRSVVDGVIAEKPLSPPVFSARFAKVQGGRVTVSGYVYQIFLPGKDGECVPEADKGGSVGCPVDVSSAETLWVAYAWPEEYGVTGKRSFMINQSGDILVTNATGKWEAEMRWVKPGQSGFCGEGGCSARVAANSIDAVGDMWTVI